MWLYRTKIEQALGVLGIVAIVLVAGLLISRSLYRETTLEEQAAQERISALLDIPRELVVESTAQYRRVDRLMRAGPLYLRFDGSERTLGAVLDRWRLEKSATEPLVMRESAPPWWPSQDFKSGDVEYYKNSLMKIWVRRADQVCFVFQSYG